MIKYAEIYKQNIQGEIRYVAKMYVTYRDEMIDSFSSSCLEKVVEYLISKEYVITNYFDMTERRKIDGRINGTALYGKRNSWIF